MIIGLGHKKQVGKDTVANIICSLNTKFEKKSFAHKLKQIASILFNVPIEKWEDPEFKERIIGYGEEKLINGVNTREGITPRTILQKIGEILRNNLYENVWVNALLNASMLKPAEASYEEGTEGETIQDSIACGITTVKKELPDWIITDVRYKNEAEAIKSLGGILIKVDRETGYKDNHISETALDDYQDWDYVIDNNGTLEELIDKVKELYDRTEGFRVFK